MRPSITRDMVRLVRSHGPVTADDLVPFAADYTREQIARALNNCANRGHVTAAQSEHRNELGQQYPTVYCIGDIPRGEYRIRRVSSVWDLGQPAA